MTSKSFRKEERCGAVELLATTLDWETIHNSLGQKVNTELWGLTNKVDTELRQVVTVAPLNTALLRTISRQSSATLFRYI